MASSDDDLEAILAERKPPITGCRVCWALGELPDQTADLMRRVLNSTAAKTAVSSAFKRRDLPIGKDSVQAHRDRCLTRADG